MAVVPDDAGFQLRSTVDKTDLSRVPADFGIGGGNFSSGPGGLDSEDHRLIFARMKEKELLPLEDVKILKGTIYSFKNRRIISRWIRDVCAAFGHKSTTFNLALQLADVFIIAKLTELAVTQCQLVALAAIWIAAKFEEMDPQVPSLNALCDVCDRAYTKEQILDMEENVLSFFKYCVPHTTAVNFMHLYLHAVPALADKAGGTGPFIGIASAATAAVVEAPRPPNSVEVLIVDRKRHLTVTKLLTNLDPAMNFLSAVTPVVGALLRLPVTASLTAFVVTRTAIRLAKPIAATATVAQVARSADGKVPLIYCRAATATSCAFAERGDWTLLRAPNDDFLRVAEACLREALINVEFMRVSPRVVALASITAALAILTPNIADAAATVKAIMTYVTMGDSLDHFKSATQLVAEKYIEAVQSQTQTPSAEVQPLVCPANLGELVDGVLGLLGSKSASRTVVNP